MTSETKTLNMFGCFICAAAVLAPARAQACEFMFNHPSIELEVIGAAVLAAISAPYAAGTALAANGLVQSYRSASPAIKAAGIAAGAALGTEWVTHNVTSIPEGIHKTIGYVARVAANGLLGYGIYKGLINNNSRTGFVMSCIGAGCVGLGMLVNKLYFKYNSVDPSIFLCADERGSCPSSWTRTYV